MIIDATFWVAVSFFIFIGLIVYFKIPGKVLSSLENAIKEIKNQVENAENLKEEAKALLSKNDEKLGKSSSEIKSMIKKANEDTEQKTIKVNHEFHKLMEIRKKNAELRIAQMKEQAIKDIKNASVKIAIDSVERLMTKSLDKAKLDKIFDKSIEETKLALKNKSS
tara:strand:- start:1294 stop:1791 length:498 start_codon:yes stop_codon:yes gene_type:complete